MLSGVGLSSGEIAKILNQPSKDVSSALGKIKKTRERGQKVGVQELISRARLLFDGSPKRLEVFELVNGKRSNKELAVKTGKTFANTLTDLSKMKALESDNHQERCGGQGCA